MQSACIMLGAVAVTTLELTKQIQQLPAQQRVQAICSVGLERSPEKERLTMLTQNMSGVSYVADHSMRQLQLQAVTQ